MHRPGAAAVAIAAGCVVERCTRAGGEPDFEGADEDTVRVVRVYGDGLVVPVLWVIAGTGDGSWRAVLERGAVGAGHLCPVRAAIGRDPDAELAARGVVAAAVVNGRDGLHLCIDIVRVAGRDGNVNTTELVADAGAHISYAAAGIQSQPAVQVAGDRRKVTRAAASGNCTTVDSVRSVLVEVVLYCRGEPTHAHG